jgi:Lrp/AsnC family leucine-responsive transcriptional regulator
MAKNKEIKLDLKDKKILFELDFNARASNAEIARKVRLSKQGVDYKIQKLIQKGVITGFYPILSLTKLGYIYGRFFIKFQNLTREKEQEIINEIVQDEHFKWVLKSEGNYDLLITYWASSLIGYKKASDELITRFGPYIKEKKESIGINVVHFQSRYISDAKETKEVAVKEELEKVELDESDKRLLKVICADGRKPIVEIAADLNVSPKVVAYRLKKLEKEGVILGYRPNIDHNLLGFTHYKVLFHLMNLTEAKLNEFKNYLKSLPEVLYVVEEIGMCDIDIELMLKSSQDFFQFINSLKFRFPTLIKDYEVLLIAKTFKIVYLPFE